MSDRVTSPYTGTTERLPPWPLGRLDALPLISVRHLPAKQPESHPTQRRRPSPPDPSFHPPLVHDARRRNPGHFHPSCRCRLRNPPPQPGGGGHTLPAGNGRSGHRPPHPAAASRHPQHPRNPPVPGLRERLPVVEECGFGVPVRGFRELGLAGSRAVSSGRMPPAPRSIRRFQHPPSGLLRAAPAANQARWRGLGPYG